MRQVFFKTLLIALMVIHINYENAHCQPSFRCDTEENDGELSTRPSTAYLAPYRNAYEREGLFQPPGDEDERHSPLFQRQPNRHNGFSFGSRQLVLENDHDGEREPNIGNHQSVIVTLTEDRDPPPYRESSINDTRSIVNSSGYQGGSSCFTSFSSLYLSPPPQLPSQTSIRGPQNLGGSGGCGIF